MYVILNICVIHHVVQFILNENCYFESISLISLFYVSLLWHDVVQHKMYWTRIIKIEICTVHNTFYQIIDLIFS